MIDFDAWWFREGQYLDPDTDDVPWFDKRKALAEYAFRAAIAMSTNYIADRDTSPRKITFANGRVVELLPGEHRDDACLDVYREAAWSAMLAASPSPPREQADEVGA